MTFLIALICVIQKESLQPGVAALALTYALNITISMIHIVKSACDFENGCVALERILEYSKLKPEASWEQEKGKNVPKLCDDWPQEGKIQFENYKTTYRDGMEPVLKDINLIIDSQEKIGICGRTGAGKSSLTLSLFRLFEATEGQIFIDSVDVSKLGLHQLRSKLAIIPQDPVLFTGSLRFNLDPTGEHCDKSLWDSLELSHLQKYISENLEMGLDNEVSEGGSNFSVGQRQLICLARALLRKAKILILDEATAAVDPETDDLIQATIRQEFKDCTVLTIAHRLNTILDSSRIVVLSQGEIFEIDTPSNLLSNPSSSFHLMACDAGIISKYRDVTTGATGATEVAPKSSDTLTLSQPRGTDSTHHYIGRS